MRRAPRGALAPAAAALLAVLLPGASALAQDVHDHTAPAAKAESQPASLWEWSWDANVFLGWNYQYREFRDFQVVESQNWFMGAGERPLGRGRLRLSAMLSLEPLTVQDLGSPQAFQTGETFEGVALVDYQHPHDLFMQIAARYSRPLGPFQTFLDVSPVGEPSVGPVPFMHRPSAADNPAVPLSHHQLDATHITAGVLRAGVERNGITAEASWFRGAEPDENRIDLDMGALDSWAGRLSWRRGNWHAQVSGAYLTEPEWVEPFEDVIRYTASIGHTTAGGRVASLLAWGQNREIHGVLDAYLFESTARLTDRDTAYARAELVAKNILGAGARHRPGFRHFHPISRVGALTLGYVRDLRVAGEGRWGVGGDVTIYHVAENLRPSYGSPASFHLFLRYRPGRQMHQH